MKDSIKKILTKAKLFDFAVQVKGRVTSAKRWISNTDRRLIRAYFAKHEIKKLHIGCGIHTMKGWLNSDFFPKSADTLFLDATTTFPFEDNSFDYIFSEHMIEHISYADGFKMISECHRVLKPNGKIRISTPDLKFLIELYRTEKTPTQDQYIKWTSKSYNKTAPYPDEAFVINNFFRSWGHRFIYDSKTLGASLERAGFTQVENMEINKSEETAFQDLEYEGRMPEGFVKLESFILEAKK